MPPWDWRPQGSSLAPSSSRCRRWSPSRWPWRAATWRHGRSRRARRSCPLGVSLNRMTESLLELNRSLEQKVRELETEVAERKRAEELADLKKSIHAWDQAVEVHDDLKHGDENS